MIDCACGVFVCIVLILLLTLLKKINCDFYFFSERTNPVMRYKKHDTILYIKVSVLTCTCTHMHPMHTHARTHTHTHTHTLTNTINGKRH